MARMQCTTNRWKYITDDFMFKVMKAIKGGMNEAWEFKERFGKDTVLYTLRELGYVTSSKKDGIRITPEGEQWFLDYKNGNIKTKSNM